MTVVYEWDAEQIETASGDIVDHNHFATYAELVAFMERHPPIAGEHYAAVLVRDTDSDRAWAYMADGGLPDEFEDAMGFGVARVPKRFRDEVTA